jgi:hypothetical protein
MKRRAFGILSTNKGRNISQSSKSKKMWDAHRSISMIEQIRRASFPIYGPEDQPFNFTICGFSIGTRVDKLVRIGFCFAESSITKEKESFYLESSNPQMPGGYYPLIGDLISSPLNFHYRLFEKYHFGAEIPQFAATFSKWEGEFVTRGETLFGESYSWLHPRQMVLFLFRGEQTLLYGDAIGLTGDHLLGHLQHLVPVNQREDLLTRYQHELDEERQRLLESE